MNLTPTHHHPALHFWNTFHISSNLNIKEDSTTTLTISYPGLPSWPTPVLSLASSCPTPGLPLAYPWPPLGLPLAYPWPTPVLPLSYPWPTHLGLLVSYHTTKGLVDEKGKRRRIQFRNMTCSDDSSSSSSLSDDFDFDSSEDFSEDVDMI
jgi:hypothetical protein